MPFTKKRIIQFFIGGCIVIALMWLNGQYISNHFGWGWENNLPDHLRYRGRDYALGVMSGCQTRTDIEEKFPGIVQIGTMPMLFGSSYPQFTSANEAKGYSTTMIIFVEVNKTCYRTYSLEGGP